MNIVPLSLARSDASTQIPQPSDHETLCGLSREGTEAKPLWKRIAPFLHAGNLFVAAVVTGATVNRLFRKEVVHWDEFYMDILIHLYQAKVITEVVKGSLSKKAVHAHLGIACFLNAARLTDIVARILSQTSVVPTALEFTDSLIHGVINSFGNGVFWTSWWHYHKTKMV